MGCTQTRARQQQDPLPLLNMLIVGLTGAGKSTILNQLKGEPQATCTQQLGIDSFIINKKIKIIAFQVAGRASSSWYHYYMTSSLVLLVIDASMQSQYYNKIKQVLKDMDEKLTQNAKIIIVFNKIDLLIQNAIPPVNQQTSHVTQYLDHNSAKVKQLSKINFHHLKHEVFTCKCSAKDKIGVNNLMRKIYALAYHQIYGDDQEQNQVQQKTK